MIIRRAVAEDWPQTYRFFTEIVAAGESYTYPDALSSEEARTLWIEQPPGQTIVATDEDIVLGSAKMGPNRPGRGAHVATASFMVAPAHQGRGVGRALAESSLDWARHAGYRGMQFNAVVETNVRAVRLWEALGFEILTTVPGAFCTQSTATWG